MITQGLGNFDQARERELTTESELKVTCPNHQSQWGDSVEQVRETRKQNPPDVIEED
jgi:hypothetical protein